MHCVCFNESCLCAAKGAIEKSVLRQRISYLSVIITCSADAFRCNGFACEELLALLEAAVFFEPLNVGSTLVIIIAIGALRHCHCDLDLLVRRLKYDAPYRARHNTHITQSRQINHTMRKELV